MRLPLAKSGFLYKLMSRSESPHDVWADYVTQTYWDSAKLLPGAPVMKAIWAREWKLIHTLSSISYLFDQVFLHCLEKNLQLASASETILGYSDVLLLRHTTVKWPNSTRSSGKIPRFTCFYFFRCLGSSVGAALFFKVIGPFFSSYFKNLFFELIHSFHKHVSCVASE